MSLNDSHPLGYIRTPVELDAAARALDRALLQTPSPQKRFLLITEFWSHTQSLPPTWVSSYLLPLAPTFVELVWMPTLSNIPPAVWRDAWVFLQTIAEQGWTPFGTDMEQTRLFAMEQTIRSHAFVSALRELHQFLLDNGVLDGPLDVREWTVVFAASTSAFGLFRAYVAVMQERGSEKVPLLKRILRGWQTYRDREQAVSVVLLEADGDDRHAAGRVLLMDILPQEGVTGESNLNNLLGEQGYETVEQLGRAQGIAENLISMRFGRTPPHRRYHFSLHETSAALVGGSLGCAAAAGLAVGITQQLNLAERWTLPTTTACVGGLSADGMLEAARWEPIEKKLRIAFYSPLEKIIIPALHREAAMLLVQHLQREYPNRQLEVIGINRFADLVEVEGAVNIMPRRGTDRLSEYLSRHSVPFLLLLVVILLGGGGYFAYKAYYDFPNLELAMGLSVGPSSIVYNPKDSLEWCLRDGRVLLENRVGFGDIEVGDGFTRTFHVWNMTPSSVAWRLGIEGSDSADWQINSGESTLNIHSATSGRITLMFAPLREGSDKRAALVLRDATGRRVLFRLELDGSAGRPLAAGYALRLDGKDDQLHFGKRSTAFDLTASESKEATFECWVRPTAIISNAMILHNGQSIGQNSDIEDLFFGFASPDTLYYRVGSALDMFVLKGRQVAAVGQWMHLALAISIPNRRIAVYVNGEEVGNRQDSFLFDGPGTPFVTIGARNTGVKSDLHFNGDIDEVRLWHRFRSREEIVANMRRRLPGLTPGLVGYWDMDATVEGMVFNANTRAHSGSLLGRPVLRRSDLQREAGSSDFEIVTGASNRPALQLRPGRYLVGNHPPLRKRGDATFAFWFLETGKPAIHFNYVLKNRGWISVENSMLFTMKNKQDYVIPPGWHLGVCTVSSDGKLLFYLDGKVFAETRTVPDGAQDWHAFFEGMMLGFRFDKEQQLASKYYDWYHPTLSHARSYEALHVWKRRLTETEIQELYIRNIVPSRDLAASWQLGTMPDGNGNFVDAESGHLLHIKRIRSWE